MSASNATSFNLQSLSEEAVAISADSTVVDQRSNLQPQQINDALGIDSLPDEMIVEVFSHLSQNQLGQIARVCRRWNVLTKSPVLWKKVDAKLFCTFDAEKNAQSFKSFIDGLPSCVTFIRIDFEGPVLDFLDFEKLCMKLHHNCSHVEVIVLKRCNISKTLPRIINSCTQFLQGLKKLGLQDCRCLVCSGTAELEENSNIEVLDLTGSGFSFSNKIQFSKLPSLKELRLAGTSVDDDWFVGATSLLNQLHVLDLRLTSVTASIFTALQRHGQNLRELYLCHLDLEDYDFSFNNSVFPHLKTICLSDTSVTCQGLVSLVRSCPSLVSVYVDEDVAQSFAEHPFVVANSRMSGIVKSFDDDHDHNADYLHN